MEDRDQLLIERYLAQDLQPDELSEFEIRLLEDPVLHQKLESYKLAIVAMQQLQREELKERFRQRDKMLDAKSKPPATHKGNWFGILSILVILLFFVLMWKFYFQKPGGAEIIAPTGIDTLTVDTIDLDSVTKDTVSTQVKIPSKPKKEEEIKPKSKEIVPEKSKVEQPKENVKSTQNIYAAHFEPYQDESLHSISRGEEDGKSALEKFQSRYASKNYAGALAAFNEMSASLQKNDGLRFLRANALLATNQTVDVKSILESLAQNPKSKYATEAGYYLALYHLKMNLPDIATPYLNTYLKQPSAQQKKSAKRILKALKEK